MSEHEALRQYQIYIDGDWSDAASGETLESFDPFTGLAWARIPRCDHRDADRAVEAAHRALNKGAWPVMTATQRGALLRRLGDLIARGDARRGRVRPGAAPGGGPRRRPRHRPGPGRPQDRRGGQGSGSPAGSAASTARLSPPARPARRPRPGPRRRLGPRPGGGSATPGPSRT